MQTGSLHEPGCLHTVITMIHPGQKGERDETGKNQQPCPREDAAAGNQ